MADILKAESYQANRGSVVSSSPTKGSPCLIKQETLLSLLNIG